ncbi:MAG TPA: hypothetical protein VHO43_11960, partial [Ignavibacteriales bacterium]|nr:hypothetical protein [Ignavibacteriales bacterium]
MKKTFSIVGLFLVLFTCSIFGQFNYKFSAGSGTFTALSGATQFTWATGATADEGYTNATDIGFTFKYAGTDYTQFQVSTNGFLRFGTGLASATSADALDGALRQIAAPLWNDLAVGATSDISYLIEGNAPNRTLTVEWKNVKWSKSATSNNSEFQVKLYETSNKIEFVYGNMLGSNGGSASIGLADNTVITKAGSATGKFLSINVGGTAAPRVYHQSMGNTFNNIIYAPDPNTVFTFEAVTPAPIPAGTYSIGGSSPDYKSLSDAAMALNVNGIAGPVTFKVRDGIYDDVFHLIDVAGTSDANTITLMNESGTVVLSPMNGSVNSTSGPYTADAIVRLDGTQHATIQGLTLNDNGLANNTLKFEFGVCLGNSQLNGKMVKGGRFNHLRNLKIDMKSTAGAVNHAGSIGIRFYTQWTASTNETDTSMTTSYNTIENCNITGFWRSAIKTFGINGVNPDRGNVITGNTIGNIIIPAPGVGSDIRALEMDCQSNIIIEKNKIQNIEADIMTTNNVYGIWFNPSSSGTNLSGGTITIRNNEISSLYNAGDQVTTGVASAIACNNVANNTEVQVYGNKIYDLLTSGINNGTSNARAEGIYLNMATGVGVTVKIFNNMIYDIRSPLSATTGAPNARGMALVNTGTNGTFKVYNNTVYLDNSVPPAVTKGTNVGHRSACLYLQSFQTATLDLKNNLFVNNMGTSAVGTGLSAAVCFQTTGPEWFVRMTESSDNNFYYSDTTVAANKGIALGGATVFKTMAGYRAIANMGARDANAFSADPTTSFVSAASPYDLHITPSSWLVKAQGSPLALVTTDIDGEKRSTDVTSGPVSVGADEYAATGKPSVTSTGTIADSMTTVFTGVDGKKVGELTWHKGKGTLPDSVALSYNPGSQLTTPAGSSIYKNYSVATFGGVKGWNADLKLYYNPTTELNGITETALKMHQKSSEVWSQLPTSIDTVKHFAQVNIISGADFTMGKVAPVQAPTVAEAREDLNTDLVPDRIGQTFKLTAVVVTNNLSASDTGSVYFLNDKTAGIVLSSTKKFSRELSMGDSLQVTGVISQFNGQTEITPADTVIGDQGSMVVLKANASVPAPVVITVKDLKSEQFEGNLVVVRGLSKMTSSVPWPVSNDTTLTVGTSTDSLSLFVDHDTKLP